MDKVLFVDDYAVGCRKDLNGILLLDTALQPPVGKAEDLVHLELPVTEVRRALVQSPVAQAGYSYETCCPEDCCLPLVGAGACRLHPAPMGGCTHGRLHPAPRGGCTLHPGKG